jgi:serine/threonine protein kinase
MDRGGTPHGDDDSRVVNPSLRTPPTGETIPAAELLSARSTDFGFGGEDASSDADPLVGRDLGVALIVRLIAQGGMGRVYEARQRSPARTVAVKVMRPGHRSPSSIQRFHREADLLARVRHPGIAQIHVAGSFAIDGDEIPYFVMEFVPEAEPLVRACDRRGLDARRRLELFHEVCRAVAHGHDAGIVHRDLKPGNILVAADGRPKVIDFGIARLEEDDAGGCTETGGVLGTRQYMSPEQCDGETVDPRSDVYSLGVILHELLAGTLPYDVRGKSLTEAARIVRETPPRSLRIADRLLGPGIDAIAGKCLAKRPGDRYATAGALADDVQRLLAGLPVSARRPGPVDGCLAWCRRHRTLSASIAAALATAAAAAVLVSTGRGPPPWQPAPMAATVGPKASFASVSSGRTSPLKWISVNFDESMRSLSVADLRLTRDGIAVPLDGVRVMGDRDYWEIRGLEAVTAAEGRYELELAGTPTTPVDFAGRRLAAPARATWRMPAYREVAFNLLDDAWKQYVVSMTDIECYTEQHAGAATFFRPTIPGKEGAVVMRFTAPFEIQSATLTAGIAVWTTGDPFPYDPGAKASIDVSRDGQSWTTLRTLEANKGGFASGPFDIADAVAGSREVWVRARLVATREWPGDGMIYAQFMRSDAKQPQDKLRLALTGPHPRVIPAADPPGGG